MQNAILQGGTIDPPCRFARAATVVHYRSAADGGWLSGKLRCHGVAASGRQVPFIIEFKGIDAAGTGRITMEKLSRTGMGMSI